MTTLHKTLVTATVTLLAAVGLYEAHQASQLREQITALRQERVPSSAHNPAALQAKLDALAASNAGLSTALAWATADKGRLEAEHQQARHSAALFKELAEQAATKNKNPTNAYPTMRHAWVGIGKLARLAAQSTEEDSNLTADEKAAIKAARSNIFEEFGSILKAMQHLDEESPTGAEPTKEDPADDITCLLFGALGLNEPQFGAVYNLVQKYQQQAKQFAPDGKPPGSEMAVQFKRLLEEGKTELLAVLTPEQAGTFEKIGPQFQFEPDKFNFSFDFSDK